MIEWLLTSHFSFLESPAAPADYFEALDEYRHYSGFAIADRMGIYGAIEALRACEARRGLDDRGPPDCDSSHRSPFYAPGIRLHFDFADPLFVFPLHKEAYYRLNQFLSAWALEGMVAREKGLNPIPWRRFLTFLQKETAPLEDHFLFIWVPGSFYPWPTDFRDEHARVNPQEMRRPEASFSMPPVKAGHFPLSLMELKRLCRSGEKSALSLAWPLTFSPGILDLQDWIEAASIKLDIPIIATSLPLFVRPTDRELCDVMWGIRHKKTFQELGYYRQANGERRLLSARELSWHEKQWLERQRNGIQTNDPFLRSEMIAERHAFSLHELRYSYPQERIPAGKSRTEYLQELSYRGLAERFPQGPTPQVRKQLEHELKLIHDLKFEDYFLTIHDTLQYAKSQKILFQGRGSAANSTVCYCLGITSIDPVRMDLLFERFLSMERNEPPDIDVDFEHERREEVIQELYTRYGRDRAAMVATYVRFRGRMAARECGKFFGLNERELGILATEMGHEGFSRIKDQDSPPPGLRLSRADWKRFLRLSRGLLKKPRHLSIHSSGFVLASEPLSRLCVLEPARKEMRSVISWDKDDIEYLKWVKVDILSLGMLTAIRKAFHLIEEKTKQPLTLASVPQDCEETFKQIRKADTVGVFQIESRAQMNMLPRLAPRDFYDLVVEVAIVRPGPLQGGMVHPYIRRRMNQEKPVYEHPTLIPILKKTLGVPIFQEQVMKIAVDVAGFTPGEADEMRRIMSGAWKYEGKMHQIREKLVGGIVKHGLTPEYAERIYRQVEGFGAYGFPESHSASFAILSYVSAWIKCHHPAEFLCALLNSQPMGFYSPRALVADAERHGVKVHPPNILRSKEETTLFFPNGASKPSVRLGLKEIQNLSRKDTAKILELQKSGFLSADRHPYPSIADLRTFLPPKTIECLVKANACRELSGLNPLSEVRPRQMWELWKARHDDPAQIHFKNSDLLDLDDSTAFPEWSEWKSLMKDYESLGFNTRERDLARPNPLHNPVAYLKKRVLPQAPDGRAWTDAEAIKSRKNGERVFVIGYMSMRQKPPTAKGLCFLTLEDEKGFLNLVLMPDVYEFYRPVCTQGGILGAQVKIQKSDPGSIDDGENCTISLRVEKIWLCEGSRSGFQSSLINFR